MIFGWKNLLTQIGQSAGFREDIFHSGG